MRIGITGYARSGKDEVANVLIEQFGFVKVNMSDALDKYLLALNPWVAINTPEAREIEWPYSGFYRYEFICQRLDYTTRKKIANVRELLQRLGTDVGRAIDPWLWVDELEKEARKHPNVVTTGIRFHEEAEPLDVLIHVDRPGFGPVNGHASEDMEPIFRLAHFKIVNDGTLEDLREKALVVAEQAIEVRS